MDSSSGPVSALTNVDPVNGTIQLLFKGSDSGAVAEVQSKSARRSEIEKNLQTLVSSASLPVLDSVISGFRRQIRASLHDKHSPNMLASCLYRLPSGKEQGPFLSVDLGGSTFRVAFIALSPKEQTIICQDVYPVNNSVKGLSGEKFFTWMAEKVKHAIDTAIGSGVISSSYKLLNMGLSWSFPLIQTSDPSTGVIHSMGKGYTVVDEIVGWDLKNAFESRLDKLGCRVRLSAVLNDGAASMITLAYHRPATTRMGLILGTGVNAAVMTPFDLVDKKAKLGAFSFPKTANSCVFNTEASMLGSDSVIPDTIWDIQVDSMNELPGFQPLETRISGRYLGEISRLILRDLHAAGYLSSVVADGDFISTPYSLDGRLLSDFEACFSSTEDGKSNVATARELFATRFPQLSSISDEDVSQIYSVFYAVSNRSAGLTAACMIALACEMLTPENAKDCAVAYTGTVIEKYTNFKDRTQKFLDEMGEPRGMDLKLYESKNGSILGPTIAAAMWADHEL